MQTSQIKFFIIILFIVIISISFIGCKDKGDFQKITLDWSEDYIGELASGFKTDAKYKNWVLVRSGTPKAESVSILFQSNELFNSGIIEPLKKGFLVSGHVINFYYYLVVIDQENIKNYLTEPDDLVNFFGEIDSMEEALMIAKVNNYNIDYLHSEGSSFRLTEDGYDFLLFKEEENDKIEFRQYIVSISSKGQITAKKGEIYCQGYVDCFER